MKYILFPFKFIFSILVFLYKIRTVLFILAFIYFLLWCWRFFIVKYRFRFNESDCWMFFGLPGSGKSTLLADIVRQIKKYKKFKLINVFANFPVHGAKKISRQDIGTYDLLDKEHNKSLLLLDEASTVYFKRNAVSKDPKKQFQDRENEFYSMHRHYHSMVCLFAQSWDGVDLRLRELSTRLFYVQKSRIRNFIKIRRIVKIFSINDEHQPCDGYEFEKFSSRYVYAPRCWKLFDTYHAPDLEKKEFDEWYPSPINEPSPDAMAPRSRGWFRGKLRRSEIVRSSETIDANDSELRQENCTGNTE